MVSRSSLVVNARVHLPGSRGRSAVIANNIEYVATREGADKSATVDDLRRSELAERMGLVGYYAERPGSTALFDQNGAVQLRAARRELEKADGAIATVVLSVRRDEACELDLACKEDWQRFCRRNLAPALAEAMDIPESSVRWVAAEHENHPNSKHVHVIAWSSDGSFDSLMARNRLDRARNALTDAALTPALAAEYEARDLARSRASYSAASAGVRAASVSAFLARSSLLRAMSESNEPSDDHAITCTCLEFGWFSCSAATQRTLDSGMSIASASAGARFRRQKRCQSSLHARSSSHASSLRTLSTTVAIAPSAFSSSLRAARSWTAPFWSKSAVDPGLSA